MRHLSVFLLLFLVLFASAKTYVFPGCEINSGITFTTHKGVLEMYANDYDITTPMIVKVTQPGKTFKDIKVPLPDWTWTPVLVNMTETLNIILPDTSTSYPTIVNQEPIDGSLIKEIQVFYAFAAMDCPQGLPYWMVHSKKWKPFPFPTNNKGEVFLIMPLANLKARIGICGKSCDSIHDFFICSSEDADQLKLQKSGDNCSELWQYHFYRLQIHFENGETKVETANKEVASIPMEDEYEVAFITIGTDRMIVIQCVKDNCEEGTTDLPRNDEDAGSYHMIILVLHYFLVVLLGIAWILDCLRRRHQMHQLRADHAHQMLTANIQTSTRSDAQSSATQSGPHSSTSSATHPPTHSVAQPCAHSVATHSAHSPSTHSAFAPHSSSHSAAHSATHSAAQHSAHSVAFHSAALSPARSPALPSVRFVASPKPQDKILKLQTEDPGIYITVNAKQ